MKQCPACEFIFPDFHLVCDFDGADLVAEPAQPLVTSMGDSRLRGILKSPFFLFVVFGIALLASAILIGYFDSMSQSAPPQRDQSSVTAIKNP